MKKQNKGLLNFFLVIVAIAVLTVVAVVGVGAQHKGSAKNIRLGLDLAGGVSITYETVKNNPTKQQMADTIYKIQRRVENYSTEAVVYQEGNNRINVDIPGVTDANAILEELGNAGSIQFIDSNKKVVIDGSDITTAKAGTIQGTTGANEYVVELTLNAAGTKKFATATKNNIGKTISIVYDGNVISAPTVNEAITGGKAQISGQSTYKEAENLASTIRIGALPLELKELQSKVVGAKLGDEAMNTSLFAGAIGFLLIILFMLIVYRVPGLAASIALCLYLALTMVALNGLNVTLTLPGIAGIILSIGMAVDANVIIFARIKEELAAGKSVLGAFQAGHHRALSAIIDGNVTTLIAAAVLWFKGSGTVKGFAQTLALGVVLSMFTAVVITKALLYALYEFGLDDVKYYGVQKPLKTKNMTKHAWKFYVLSGTIIAIGIGSLIYNKANTGAPLKYGLDFMGGTSTQVTFNEKIDAAFKADLTSLVSDISGNADVELSTVNDSNAIIIKTSELSLAQRDKLSDKLVSTYGIKADDITSESISGTVSNEMKTDAIVSLIIATICMLIYIWIRFKDVKFATSAVIALLHDVFVVVMVYSLTGISVGSTFIACILTIVGYSINSTIVTFDRVRENIPAMQKKHDLEEIVNVSITQTIIRNINTNLTVLITLVILYFIGVASIKEFTLPIIVGVACGAYTSICLTATMWYMFKKMFTKKA